MRRSTTLQTIAVASVFLAAGCTDRNEPTAPSDQPDPLSQSLRQGPGDNPNALARGVRGFGGFFFDAQGRPTVYLKNAAERSNAERALAPFFQAQGRSPSAVQVRRGDFDWIQLERWFAQASAEVLGQSGAVFVDADEASNRLRIGVERGATGQARSLVARLGIPAEAVIVEETEPITFAATLRDRVRPVVGGLQINFPGFLCTLGFNGVRSGQNSFITNSHCTNSQGGSETPTDYYQPLQDPEGDRLANPENFIGVEVDDPHYWISLDCAVPGFMCRYSDAARAEYAPDQGFALGRLARTAARDPDLGTLEVDGEKPSFQIVAEQAHSVMGEEANKVGRTTGWTFGPVIATCINSIVLGAEKPIIQLCQTRVRAGVAGGDSGSPVFRPQGGGDRATLLGILWGGSVSGEVTFVFSPMFNIERELGLLTTHQ
jgi:hypothetical protein